jgi:hypothetical protein
VNAPDRSIAELALRQHGAFSARQAKAIGLTDDQIAHRLRLGRWHRAMRGVFLLAGVAPSSAQKAMVAHLSRPGSTVSHLAAALHLGHLDAAPPRPDLTVAPGSSGRSPVATIHRLHLPPHHVTVVRALPVTNPARTLVDCATVLGPRRLQRLVDTALQRGSTTPLLVDAALDVVHHLTNGQRTALLAALEVWRPTIRPGSIAEARLLRQLDDWGIEAPERQVPIFDHDGEIIGRADVGWADRRCGIEYDSVEWHGPSRWVSDEQRHARIASRGLDAPSRQRTRPRSRQRPPSPGARHAR